MKLGRSVFAALFLMSSTACFAFKPANAAQLEEQQATPVGAPASHDQIYVDAKDLDILHSKRLADPVRRFYPSQAMKLGIEGRTVIDCAIGVRGKFDDCRVVEEDPVGYGFGVAAASFFGGGFIRADSVLNTGAPLPVAARVKFKFIFRMPR